MNSGFGVRGNESVHPWFLLVIFGAPALTLVVVVALLLVGPQRARRLLAVVAYMLVGAILGLSPLELGIYGLLLSIATLLMLLFVPNGLAADSQRLERVGGYLTGAGTAGNVLLLPLVIRIHQVCGSVGGRSLAPGQSFECFSESTLWAVLIYVALGALGALMVLIGVRQSPRTS